MLHKASRAPQAETAPGARWWVNAVQGECAWALHTGPGLSMGVGEVLPPPTGAQGLLLPCQFLCVGESSAPASRETFWVFSLQSLRSCSRTGVPVGGGGLHRNAGKCCCVQASQTPGSSPRLRPEAVWGALLEEGGGRLASLSFVRRGLARLLPAGRRVGCLQTPGWPAGAPHERVPSPPPPRPPSLVRPGNSSSSSSRGAPGRAGASSAFPGRRTWACLEVTHGGAGPGQEEAEGGCRGAACCGGDAPPGLHEDRGEGLVPAAHAMSKDRGWCPTCLLCLYSCRWSRSKKGLRTSKCDCAWFFFLFCVCLFTLVWLYFALVTLNDFHNLNEYIFRKTEWWLDWSVVMLSGTAMLVTYSSLLLVLALCLQLCHQPLKLHWLHKTLLILTALVVAAAFVGLQIQWVEQWESAHISLQATGPFLHIGAVVGLTLLAWPVASWFYRISHAALKVLLLLLYLGAVLALYVAPLGIDSPCLLEHSQLPPKPALFGHRGAPMLAPENTLMSFQKAADCGVRVFETDVLVSADGVPFLMHDERLSRTTNVKEAFPTRAHLNASAFNWTELQQLDAGSWFLEKRPFPTARSLSLEDRAQAQAQRIPSLKQLLGEAGRHNRSVMFDLRPEEDPQYEQLVNITVETILQSGIAPELILWLPDAFREQVQQKVPQFRQVYGRKRLSNETGELRHVNLPYQNLSTAEIREYRRDNISVNLFVVNTPWLFSVLWCAGTSSVTTNACQVLQGMERPLWLLPRATYQMIWIVTDCVSLLLISWAFLLLKRWNRKSESAGSDSVVLLTKIHSLLSE